MSIYSTGEESVWFSCFGWAFAFGDHFSGSTRGSFLVTFIFALLVLPSRADERVDAFIDLPVVSIDELAELKDGYIAGEGRGTEFLIFTGSSQEWHRFRYRGVFTRDSKHHTTEWMEFKCGNLTLISDEDGEEYEGDSRFLVVSKVDVVKRWVWLNVAAHKSGFERLTQLRETLSKRPEKQELQSSLTSVVMGKCSQQSDGTTNYGILPKEYLGKEIKVVYLKDAPLTALFDVMNMQFKEKPLNYILYASSNDLPEISVHVEGIAPLNLLDEVCSDHNLVWWINDSTISIASKEWEVR